MCPTKETRNVKDQKTIESTLVGRFGQDKANELLNTYYDNFWTKQDFENCETMGLNCLRLPIWYKKWQIQNHKEIEQQNQKVYIWEKEKRNTIYQSNMLH